MDIREEQFKRMVLAYLHDPPHKVLDLGKHEEFAKSFVKTAWVDRPAGYENLDAIADDWEKSPDHAASAADRVVFPNKTGKAGGKFEGEIKHSLGAGTRKLTPCTVGKAEEDLQNSFGGIKANSWREFFFLLWRRWREETAVLNSDLEHYPADTRIPDHSIWLHMDLTAAFEACRSSNHSKQEPAFLLFQLGPVQEFIAAARSTRDLWSGSYLISWLTGHALKAVTDEVGPTSIVFPALRGLGIFDAVNRGFFENVSYQGQDNKDESLWKRLYCQKDEAETLLYPTIPNRFLALLPASRAEELARKAEQAVRDELKRIGDYCFRDLETLAGKDIFAWRLRWDKQLELMPQITWQTLPFHEDIDSALAALEKIDSAQAARMRGFSDLAQTTIPESERDGRNYRKCKRCGEFPDRCTHSEKVWELNRPEFAWSANFAEVSLRLAARRNTRDFAAFVTDNCQEKTPKDALTGKEEIIGDEEFWKTANSAFKDKEGPYGAMNIIKRLWCAPRKDSYLAKALDIPGDQIARILRFESTPELAGDNGYFAILTMDGDEMGKWISGEKAPRFLEQLKGNTREYFKHLGVSPELRRQVSPGYHLQFSEALTNFANRIAGKIVREHGGCLIYAGGDDVLAALPAKNALPCAEELRKAFQGENGWHDGIMVPGNRAEVSCGIAIAHAHYPLQRAVEEARRAEGRAKHEYGRSAFAVSLLKRGGEIIHWGANWEDNALPLFRRYTELRKDGKNSSVSGRFPYALAAVLAPYWLKKGENVFSPGFNPREVIARELDLVLERQVQSEKARGELKQLCGDYLDRLDTKTRWDDFVKLFLTEAFIERNRSKDDEGEE